MIETADKVRLVEMLARTGLRLLEVTSFVRADAIPQLADGPEVLRRADVPEEVAVSVLVPNEREPMRTPGAIDESAGELSSRPDQPSPSGAGDP